MRPLLLLAALLLSACGGTGQAPKPNAPVAMVVVPEAEPEEELEADEPEPEPPAPPQPKRVRRPEPVEAVDVEAEPPSESAILSGSSGFGSGPVSGVGAGVGGKLGVGSVSVGGGGGGTAVGWSGSSSAGTAGRPTVRLRALKVQGQLPESIVRRVLRSRSSPLRYCYRQQLKTKPGLQGTMKVSLVVAANGTVAGTQVTTIDGALTRCVQRAIQRVRFPKPKAGVVSVSYSLTFSKF